MPLSRVALFGTPGAGKSTSSDTLDTLCAERGIRFFRLKLAEPLYNCQAEIYRLAGRPLTTFYSQDGELLNYLGAYLRKINPNALLEDFQSRLEELDARFDSSENGRGLILCDDMRPLDAAHLRGLGFRLVKLTSPVDICLSRRIARGDKSIGSASHSTERGIDELTPEAEIRNDGSIAELREKLAAFLQELFK